ncbi:MAG TPA: porin family protein [Bacteroidia bacterium]|nr:porin family protein [Bacteroidia bacterium]
MKTLTAIVAGLALVGATQIHAQETGTTAPSSDGFHHMEIGFRFMPTFSAFDVRTSDNGVVRGTLTMGYGYGGLIGVNFNEHVGMQAEVIYLAMSQKYRDNGLDRTVKLNYVNIPLLLSLNTNKSSPVNLNFVAGPQIGINVGSEVTSSGGSQSDTITAIVAVKQGDLGFAYGAGLEFGLGANRNAHIDVGFRGVFGLIDISDKSQSTTTNEYYVLDRAHVQSYAGYIGLTLAF